MARVQLRAVHLLALAYLMGVAGSLWDWHEHLIGAANQFPHILIDSAPCWRSESSPSVSGKK